MQYLSIKTLGTQNLIFKKKKWKLIIKKFIFSKLFSASIFMANIRTLIKEFEKITYGMLDFMKM